MVTMLLPLLFVVPYVVLNLNFAFDHMAANGWAMNLRISFFAARMLVSLCLFSGFVFCWYTVRYLLQGNWLGLTGLLFALVFVCCMMVAFSLFFQYPGLPDGSRYQWWDWGHLSIVGYGVMFLGIPLITSYLFIEGMRLVSGFRKRGKVSQTAS